MITIIFLIFIFGSLVGKIYSQTLIVGVASGDGGSSTVGRPGYEVGLSGCDCLFVDGGDVQFVCGGWYYSYSLTNLRITAAAQSQPVYGIAKRAPASYYAMVSSVQRCIGTTCVQLSASFTSPRGIWIDSSGNIFVADAGESAIYKIPEYYKVKQRIAGTLTRNTAQLSANFPSNKIDGQIATSVDLNTPFGVWGDSNGNYFFTDAGLAGVFLLKSGKIYVIAGGGDVISSLISVPGESLSLFAPTEITGDTAGNVYVSSVGYVYVLFPTDSTGLKYNGYNLFSSPSTLTGLEVRNNIIYYATSSSIFSYQFIPPLSVKPSVQPTRAPTAPSRSPSVVPTASPSVVPTVLPTMTPSCVPTTDPTRVPTANPTMSPSEPPSTIPTAVPSLTPSVAPTVIPTQQPSLVPTVFPTTNPTLSPSTHPSIIPTVTPSEVPTWNPSTVRPSLVPSVAPSQNPSMNPTVVPTFAPSCTPTMGPSRNPTVVPSQSPSIVPTVTPSVHPSVIPTFVPSCNPTASPTVVPSVGPSVIPTAVPSQVPSRTPTMVPTFGPSFIPSVVPTMSPTAGPSRNPTVNPSIVPTATPSMIPSVVPSCNPTAIPTTRPSFNPTVEPSRVPSKVPTDSPTFTPTFTKTDRPTKAPFFNSTDDPSAVPTIFPTLFPSVTPSYVPTEVPSVSPSMIPTWSPTEVPSDVPSTSPSKIPSCSPTQVPSETPSQLPTYEPSAVPSMEPSLQPTTDPTTEPTYSPTVMPTSLPTDIPSRTPSELPTDNPTWIPTERPTEVPSGGPSYSPSAEPSEGPTTEPTLVPSESPSLIPSLSPSGIPTAMPFMNPSERPSLEPSISRTEQPSVLPTVAPTVLPTEDPSGVPTVVPSEQPTVSPSQEPRSMSTVNPSESPSVGPSTHPTLYPSEKPSFDPTANPTEGPSQAPSVTPSGVPSLSPTQVPSLLPSVNPSENPTEKPTAGPSDEPTVVPSVVPTDSPTTKNPSREPTLIPSIGPSVVPTEFPTSSVPTVFPSELPTLKPSQKPSENPSANPTRTPTVTPTVAPTTSSPTASPSEAVVPNFISAAFTNEGSSIIFKFDMTTNQGKLSNSFSCNKLFDFKCASQSVCQWTDSKTISGSVDGAEGCVVPGDSVMLVRNNNITFSCSGSNCVSNGLSTFPKSLVIQAPASPLTPTITIGVPSALGQCSSLLLDLSGSLGSGGREWRNVSVRAVASSSSNSADTTALNHFLTRNFTVSPPIVIPAVYFTAGVSYSFQVSLCNFLGRCGYSSASVVVTQTLLPTVTIDGSAVRNVLISQPISLSSTAFVANCNGNPSALGINYVWMVMNSNLQVISSVSSTSRDPSRFTLPAFSFGANKIYKVQVSASFNQQVSSALVQINTLSGALVAVIQGSGNQVVRIGSSLTLDGSKSYDQDQNNVFGISAGLSFTWICCQLSPVVSVSCSNVIESVSGSEKILVEPVLTATDVSLQFALTVRDQSGQRTATSLMNVRILPLLSTSISLRSNAVQNVINPDQSLTVLGTVRIPASLKCVLNWSTDSSVTGLALTKTALTPLFSSISASADGLNLPINLKLSPNVLLGGFIYSFTLTSRLESPGVGSSLTVTVVVNSPPKLGNFIIAPAEGEELTTLFSFSCARWQDDNLPLQYQFSYLTSTGNKLTMRSIAETSFTSLTLPAGENSRGNNIQGIADVFDSYLANVSSSTLVKVRTSSVFEDSTKVQAFLEQSSAALQSTNVDVVKQAAVTNAYLLNKMNCTSNSNGCSAQMDHRTSIIQGIQSLATLEDISTQAVSGWISYLQAATQVQNQLSVEGGNLALAVIRSIVSGVNESGLSPVVMYDALNLLDSISAIVTSNKTRNHHRGRKLETTEPGIDGLQDSLANYVKVVASSLLADEDPLAQVTSNIKTRLLAVSPDAKCSKSAQSISLPQTTKEDKSKSATSSLSFGCLSIADDLHIGLSSISSDLYEQRAFESDPLSLYLSTLPCDDPEHCFITISLARKNNDITRRLLSASSEQVSFNTTCYDEDHSEHTYRCPDGADYKVTCTGEAQLIESRCPSTSYQPSCNLLGTGGNIQKETCKVIGYTSELVTCNCSLSSLAAHRRLESSSGNSSSIVMKEVNVNYVSMLEGITTSFESTVVSASSLTTSKLEKGWQALTVVCVFVGAIVLSMVLSYRADKEAKKVEAIESKKIQSKLLGRSLSMRKKTSEPTAISSEENFLELAELALPNMLSSKPFSQKMMEELKRHHRWLGIIFHFSEKLPRILRVLSLATNVIIMLFIQSLTYSLSKGDEGSCSHYHEESACLAPKSAFATGQSKCYWIPPSSSSSSTTEGRCGFVTPDNSVEVILFVAIFSGIVSTPLAILADWIIIRILAAPDLHPMLKNTASKIMDINSLPSEPSKTNSSLGPELVDHDGFFERASTFFSFKRLSTFITRKSQAKDGKELARNQHVYQEFNLLTKEIRDYRLKIENQNDRNEFDSKNFIPLASLLVILISDYLSSFHLLL
jgi:hypothetical protein